MNKKDDHHKSFLHVFQEMEQFIDESFRRFHSLLERQIFPVEIKDQGENIEVAILLQDIQPEQIQLEIIGHHLRISIHDDAIYEQKNDKNHMTIKQRAFQKRERTIPFPFPISANKTTATLDKDHLVIIIPKQENKQIIPVNKIKELD